MEVVHNMNVCIEVSNVLNEQCSKERIDVLFKDMVLTDVIDINVVDIPYKNMINFLEYKSA